VFSNRGGPQGVGEREESCSDGAISLSDTKLVISSLVDKRGDEFRIRDNGERLHPSLRLISRELGVLGDGDSSQFHVRGDDS